MKIPEITYPELRALKGKYGLTDIDLGNIIGNNCQTVSKKMRLLYDFTQSDMLKISKYFISKGEDGATVQKLFIDWIVSNETLLNDLTN